MDAKVFKKIIMEAVRIAVRQELRQLLAEHAASQLVKPNSILSENLNFSSNDVGPNHYPMSPSQQSAKKASMEKMFKQQTKPVQQANDWSFGANMNQPEPSIAQNNGKSALAGGGDFSAFLADTAVSLTPSEVAQMRMGGE